MGRKRGNGEGNIIQLKNNTWMGKVMLGHKADGKPNRVSFYGKTRKEVSEKLIAATNDFIKGNYIEPSKLLLKDWLNKWMQDYKKINLKPKTYDTYETQIRHNIIPDLGDIYLNKLTIDDIQKLYNNKYNNGSGLSSATVRKLHSILNSALNQAVDSGKINKNPTKGAKLPELSSKEIKAFTREEQNTFFEYAKDYRLYKAFIFHVDTGLRMGELLALTWDDIDLDNQQVSVNKNIVYVKDRNNETDNKNMLMIQKTPKTKASIRKVPLTQRSILMLKSLKMTNKSNIVFCSEKETYITPRNYERTFNKVLKKAGMEKCNPHTLRHTYATRLFECGVDVKVVSGFLGHSKVSHTQDIYTHVMPNIKNQAVKALDNLYFSDIKSQPNLQPNQPNFI